MSENRESNKLVTQFLTQEKGEFSEIRSVLVFGRNTATYKFAFCHALLQHKAKDSIRYDELKKDMVDSFISHYLKEKKQFTRGETNLTRAIDQFAEGKISRNNVDIEAEKVIFNNVLDAFQNVGGSVLDKKHLLFDHDKKSKKIVLTDRLNSLLDRSEDKTALQKECDSRWSVVEEAWRNDLSPNLIYDPETQQFVEGDTRRVAVRSALASLLPYQKGRCFYCARNLELNQTKEHVAFADVDHFIPISLFKILPRHNPNGVWNLVIACKSCNRGESGKFNKVPDTKYFEKLLTRNLYFSIEHMHSLKTSILLSLGAKSAIEIKARMAFIYDQFPFEKWKPAFIFE